MKVGNPYWFQKNYISSLTEPTLLYQKSIADMQKRTATAISAPLDFMAKVAQSQTTNRNMKAALGEAVKIDMRLASPAQQYQNIMKTISENTYASRQMRSQLFSSHIIEILNENIAEVTNEPIDIASDFFDSENKGTYSETQPPKRKAIRKSEINANANDQLPANHKDSLSNKDAKKRKYTFSQEQYYEFLHDYIPDLVLFLVTMPNGYGVATAILVTIYRIAIEGIKPK